MVGFFYEKNGEINFLEICKKNVWKLWRWLFWFSCILWKRELKVIEVCFKSISKSIIRKIYVFV